ncbi:MAG: NAD(P)-dependent oxidoreductase [Bacteroidales bacterium]
MEKRERVLLTGASGSMGFETFKGLWARRDRFEIVLLVRPTAKEKRLFRKYEEASGIAPIRGAGTVTGDGLKIVWGDALHGADVEEACRGIDWCLHVMALISPAADRNPEMAHRVNYLATKAIVEAIEAQDPGHIRMVYIGSVAEYGDRLPPFHVGRTGDPVLPSEFDYYALSKISAELAVMQSRIKHRVSLRQTFIMIPGLFSLQDPIMYHQPVNSFMENIAVRDAGRVMMSCLDQPGDSPFWGGYYNISGGPQCRTNNYELLDRVYNMLGIRLGKVMDRNWFALKNFHMMFYEDAGRLNSFLHHWEGGMTLEEFYVEVKRNLPWYLKLTAKACSFSPLLRWVIEQVTRKKLERIALEPEGTLRWIREGNMEKIHAFFGSEAQHRAIPGWETEMPSLDPNLPYHRLDHGYDETREKPGAEDLQQAAYFRGGALKEHSWNGDMHTRVSWSCCLGHSFGMTPHAVLKGGHWCPQCLTPPWKTAEIAKKSKFVGQLFTGRW